MAFKQVFSALRELFPQVDLRILKAVASQYSSNVDAAIGFVLSDVLPAVSEPTETHYALQDIDYDEHDHPDSEKPKLYSGRISFVDRRARDDTNAKFSTSAGNSDNIGECNPLSYDEPRISLVDRGARENSNVVFSTPVESSGIIGECNQFSGYDEPLFSHNKMEEFSQIEDKVVINETRIDTEVMSSLIQDHCAQVGSSSSATEPHIVEYEQSSSAAFIGYCAAEKDKVTPKTETIGKHKHYNDNYELSCLFASSGSMLPLYLEGPSDCALKYGGSVPSKLFNAESKHDFSKSKDNYYLETLCVNFHSKEDRQTPKNLPIAPTVHKLSKSEDSNDLQVWFEKEVPPKLSKAEGIHLFSKPEDNSNLENLFVNFSLTEDTYILKNLPSAPAVHTQSKSEDNCDLQVLFENIDNAGKELGILCTAENPPKLHKSENDGSFYNLFVELCTADSTTQVPSKFHGKDEFEQSLCKLDDQQKFFDLFVSFKMSNSSLHMCQEKGDSHTVDTEDQPSIDFKNHGTFTSMCNLDDEFNLSETLSSTQNASMSNLDSTCDLSNEAERRVMCSNIVDKHFVCPVVELDAFPPNEKRMMPGAHTSEEFLDISTQSYHITELNKNISDITKSKELLSSLYESTTMKMKEVQLQEEKSRQANQNADKAHQKFISMVEHFNQLIKKSKESNDKQAQVMRKEKCSLVALAQDLQSQLSKLSAQRDEALTTVQQIKFELDARLATSLEEEVTAVENIFQEEKLALQVRKEKEATMGSIMEESRKLEKEAEENILLRRILLDRGRIIDILQGEISSIHANVVAMKERACSATSSHMDDCKSASIGIDWCLGNDGNRNGLPQEEMVGSHAKDHTASSDNDDDCDGGWEVLEKIGV